MQNVPCKKKLWNPRWWARNGCDGSLMAKCLTAIQVNFVLIPSEAGMRQHKFIWIVVIKNFALNYHHSHFLAATLNFTTFLYTPVHGAFCMGATPFFTATLFLSVYMYKHVGI